MNIFSNLKLHQGVYLNLICDKSTFHLSASAQLPTETEIHIPCAGNDVKSL